MSQGDSIGKSSKKYVNERRMVYFCLLIGISMVAVFPLFSTYSSSSFTLELENQSKLLQLQKENFSLGLPKEEKTISTADSLSIQEKNTDADQTKAPASTSSQDVKNVDNEAQGIPRTTAELSNKKNEAKFQSTAESVETKPELTKEKQVLGQGNASNYKNNTAPNQIKQTLSQSSTTLEQKSASSSNNSTNKSIVLDKIAFAGSLNCDRFGGPSIDVAQEMVYWRDIPSDQPVFRSPFLKKDREQYLIFEADEAGWNNVRMGFETVVGMAIAMGRTLVMPPKLHFSQYWDYGIEKVPITVMGFEDYFAMNETGLKIISFQNFLENVALKGKFIDVNTGKPTFPPKNNLTDWNGLIKNYEGVKNGDNKILYQWLRNVSTALTWKTDECVAAFPSAPGPEGPRRVQAMLDSLLNEEDRTKRNWWERLSSFTSNPTPVNASAVKRLRELITNRRRLCIYDEKFQDAQVVHAYGEQDSGYRMLIHFYAFLFCEDWKMDVYIKRFIRDRIRYIDQLHCAAARIVAKVRQIARENGQLDGGFDTFHIRRNDFKSFYGDVVLTAEQIYNDNTSPVIREKRTVYVATDEKDLSFFLPLREHYNLVFMKDFMGEIQDIIPNFYGLIDELVTARGETFVGTFYSTFSGYINRLRGYFADRNDGSSTSYYNVPQHLKDNRDIMTRYTAIVPPYWAREFPVCWRDIDHGLRKVNRTRLNNLNYTALSRVLV